MNRALQIIALPWEESRPIFWGVLIAVCVSTLGGLSTPLTDWYYNLTVPGWKPPNWLFGPVWTTIFILATFAGVKSWKAHNSKGRKRVLQVYVANGSLNVCWSILFFTLQRPDLALFEIPLLLASILGMILLAKPAGLAAQLALVPYLIWVSFASVLNWSLATLNGYL